MLLDEERVTLERSLATILQSPNSVSQGLYNEVYNTVYVHCTASSEEYFIKGSLIYDLLSSSIDAFTSSLEFQGSITSLAEQAAAFRSSLSLLARIFSYLERFYIRTSILRDLQVQRLKELFHSKIYYNYIYNVEDSLLSLVFLEIETSRKLYRQECSELKAVVSLYLELLVCAGQDGAMRRFFKRYVDDFRAHTNFGLEIGKLLKKIYLEVFFATNVLGDKEVCREVIQAIVFRKDEIIEYVFAKITSFEKFKHIYKIISMMPEAVKGQFRCRYGEILERNFSSLNTFFEIYGMYARVREQIAANRMSGYTDLLDRIMKRVFCEKKDAIQVEIQTEMVCAIEKLIGDRIDNGKPSFQRSVSDAIAIADRDCPKKPASPDTSSSIDPEIYFDLFALIFTEHLMDLYTERCQYRLLKGSNPAGEQEYAEMILQRIGWNAATRLKSSVSSFINRWTLNILIEDGGHSGPAISHGSFAVSLAKVTKGFWDVERNEVNLHPYLEQARSSISRLVQLAERQRLEFNYRLSLVVFEINGRKYRISGDAFSMYLHILSAENIDVEELRSVCADRHFDANADLLVKNGLVAYDGRFRASWKQPDQEVVDLFTVPQRLAATEEAVYVLEKSIHVVESRVCSVMKRSKRMEKHALARSAECDMLEFETAFTSLVSKGFLEVRGEDVVYIP